MSLGRVIVAVRIVAPATPHAVATAAGLVERELLTTKALVHQFAILELLAWALTQELVSSNASDALSFSLCASLVLWYL